MSKAVSFAILLILIIFTISACAKSEANVKSEETTTNANQTEETTEEESSDGLPQPNLVKYDLNGREFNVLMQTPVGFIMSNTFEYFPEMAGEPVNDAVQSRIIVIEDFYNCVIHPLYVGDVSGVARKDILADGNAYDIVMPALTSVSAIAGEGLLLDMYNIGALHFEMPWWNLTACKNLSIMNKLYYTLGDVGLDDKSGLSIMIFNKAMIGSNNLELPYKYVYDNTWTLNKLYDMCRGVSRDLDGDGKMTKEDQYGLIADNNSIIFMLYACGASLVEKNKDDIPFPTVDNEWVLGIIDKIIEIYKDKTTTAETAVFGDHGQANPYFMNNQILFRITSMYRSTQIRDMESDFGFVPHPKFDEMQESHAHTYSYSCPGVGIPITVSSAEEVGAVLEALAYYGRSIIMPAYYEITLRTKVTRDEDSPLMLDIILSTTTIDLGFIYNFGGIRDMFVPFINTGNNTFASAYAKIEEKISNEIEKLVNTFKALS